MKYICVQLQDRCNHLHVCRNTIDTLCFFYKGTGANVIRADHLPDEVLHIMETEKQAVHLRSESTHQPTSLGVLNLTVRIKVYYRRKPFVVVRQLTLDVILGTTFINDHDEKINIRQRHLILVEETEVPIFRCSAWQYPTYSMKKKKIRGRVKNPKETQLYVAKLALLSPQRETVVLTTIKEPRTYIL